MQLWVAFKNAPVALKRDPESRINSWRLDSLVCLPSLLRGSLPGHIELVFLGACTKTPFSSCSVCSQLPVDLAAQQRHARHFITFSVDKQKGQVFCSADRHFAPPQVTMVNGESWCYLRVPDAECDVAAALAFVQSQVGKPMRRNFYLNFLCCRSRGVSLDNAPESWKDTDAWFCSELAAAVLCLTWPDFGLHTVRDPCVTSPCYLYSLLVDLLPSSNVHFAVIPLPPLVRTVG